ncbi:MAG: family 43 glycosylhydrolase [Verrucomicrobiota bacterium]
MKCSLKLLFALLAAVLAILTIHASNPLLVGGESFYGADPSATVTEDGKLYMVVTTDSLDWDKQVGWDLYTTEDLVNWTNLGTIFDHEDSTWGINNAWAPDLATKDGQFYLYFYFRNGGKDGGVGIAIADGPTGEYKETTSERLFKGHDPAIFSDIDGTPYIFVQDKAYRLNRDLTSIEEGPINLNLAYRPEKFEAAYVFYREGIYYFTIARAWNNLIYYTSDKVLGPYTFRGEIMKPYGGNNHHSIVNYKGQWIMFHHEWVKDKPGHKGRQRRIRAEYLNFNDDGTIQLVHPTEEGISLDTLGK